MLTAPNHDWALLETRAAASDRAWLQGLSAADKFALYCSLYRMAGAAPRDADAQRRLDQWAWDQKLALRLRLVDAFQKLDHLHSERPTPNDAD
jgi:hypothetical protein